MRIGMSKQTIKRMVITLVLIAIPFIIGMLITYEVVGIEFISFMENQRSFRPMENPLVVPPDSIPIEGAAYVGGIGSPENPIEADELSIQRGVQLYDINCRLCHGYIGKGDGPIAAHCRA